MSILLSTYFALIFPEIQIFHRFDEKGLPGTALMERIQSGHKTKKLRARSKPLHPEFEKSLM